MNKEDLYSICNNMVGATQHLADLDLEKFEWNHMS